MSLLLFYVDFKIFDCIFIMDYLLFVGYLWRIEILKNIKIDAGANKIIIRKCRILTNIDRRYDDNVFSSRRFINVDDEFCH